MAMVMALDLHLPSWLGHPVELHQKAPPRGPKPRPAVRNRFGLWTLEVKQDPFDGRVSCSLRAPRMNFEHAAVSFQFHKSVDTFDAEYRIDEGKAYSWRISAMALAAHGVKIQSDDAHNPSGGVVPIPYNALIGGKTVWIRPGPKASPALFKLDGLSSAVTAARDQGCGAEFAGAPIE